MIKKLFNNDNFLRIFSLCIALLLWMYIVSLNNPQVEIPINGIDIEIRNQQNIQGNNLNIISVSDSKTSVKIFGRMSEVSAISPADIKVYVDASDIYSANSYYLSTKSEIDSKSVVVTGIDVKDVNVYVDYIQAVEKDIEILVIGEPKAGHILESAIPANDKVVIKGPQNIVNKVASIKASLDITNANSDYSTVCPVKMYTANGEVINSEYLTLTVTDVAVDVKFNATKNVEIKVDIPETVDLEMYDIIITPKTVDISGQPTLLETINTLQIGTLTESSFTSDETTVIIELPQIEGIKYNIEDKNVKVQTIPKNIEE